MGMETRTVKPSHYAYPSGDALGGTCGEEVVTVLRTSKGSSHASRRWCKAVPVVSPMLNRCD